MAARLNAEGSSGNPRAYQTVLDLVRLGTAGAPGDQHAVLEIVQRIKAYFDLPRAAVCLIDSGRYTIEYLIDDTDAYKVGEIYDVAGSWCEQVVENRQTVMDVCAGETDFARHPGLLTAHAPTYAGARILVDGVLRGTLNVTSSEARAQPFDAGDQQVLEVAAALVSHHLSLQRAEQRFDLAVSGSSVGLWDWDLRTSQVYWSPRCLEILGIADPDFRPSNGDFKRLQHPDDRELVRAALSNHFKARLPFDIECRVQHADGHYIWVHSRGQAVWDRSGTPERMAGSMDDITERKLADQALALSEERYNLAVQGAGVGIWDWDVASGEIFWSDKLVQLFKVADRTAPRSIEAFVQRIHEDDRARVQDALNRHLAGEGDYRVEYRSCLSDGSVIWLHTRGQAVWNAAGEPVRMAGSCHEVTDRKMAELQIQQQADELRRTNGELEQFAVVASHDLQEPLRKIASFGSLLARDYSDRLDERGRLLLDRMIDGAQRLRQLIQDLLGYSRSSNDAMRFEDCVLKDLVRDVCADFELVIGETGAVIECDSDAVLRGDPLLLRQLIQNLLSNALKYRSDAPPHVSIAANRSEDDSRWIVTVRDNGIGFAARHAKRVFEIFKRLHARDAYAGTGIGLALCQRVVERHGGRIWAESEPGEGATFHIELPVAPNEDALVVAG